MGVLSTFEYPDFDLTSSIDVARVIQDKFNGRVDNLESLSSVLGHSTVNSGGFRMKTAALNRYGISTGRGFVQLTDLGKKLVSPKNDAERQTLAFEAMNNVDLFKRIYGLVGDRVDDTHFWVQLTEITGAERPSAQKEAGKIQRLYEDCLRNIKIDGRLPGHTPEAVPSQERVPVIGQTSPTSILTNQAHHGPALGIKPITFQDIVIYCPPNEAMIDVAIQLLQMQKKVLGTENANKPNN